MENFYAKVREYLLDLEVTIVSEDSDAEVFVVKKEDDGVMNMVIFVSDPLIIIEQVLFTVKDDSVDTYKRILSKNRDIISGAMVLGDDNAIVFRDSLQVESLDLNELEASFESLSLLLAEFGDEILSFAK